MTDFDKKYKVAYLKAYAVGLIAIVLVLLGFFLTAWLLATLIKFILGI